MPHGAWTRAERTQHAHPPVADLVAEPLDHDGAVVGHQPAAGLGLLVEVGHQVAGGQGIEPVVALEPLERALTLGAHLAHELAQRLAQLERAAGPSPCQNGILPGWPGAGLYHHTLVGDVLDAPGAGPEQEGLAHPALVDHLLVELAHPGPVGQEDAEEATVGDGAAAGHGQALGPGPTPQLAAGGDPTPSGGAARRTRRRGSARRAGPTRWSGPRR